MNKKNIYWIIWTIVFWFWFIIWRLDFSNQSELEKLYCEKWALQNEKISLADSWNSIDYDNSFATIENKIVNGIDPQIKAIFEKANKRIPSTITIHIPKSDPLQ